MIDDKNRSLLNLLRQNARETTASLARKLKLSRTAVHERISKLERDGVISGYTLVLNESFESTLVSAHVMIEVAPKLSQQVSTQLHKIEDVQSLYSVNGIYDFIAVVKAESMQRLDTVLDRIGQIEGVEKTVSAIVLSTKFER